MNTDAPAPTAAAEAAAPQPAAAAAPAVVFQLGIVLDADTIVVAGRAGDELPAHAELAFGDDGARRGGFACYCWRAEDAGGEPWNVLAIVTAPQVVGLQGLPMRLIPAAPAAPLALTGIGRLDLEIAPLIALLRRLGADVAAIFEFLYTRLVAARGAEPPSPIGRFLEAFLGATAIHDGFIEIVGRPECGGLLFQGWSMHLAPGPVLVGIDAGGITFHQGEAAIFERADLLATATGLVVFVKSADAIAPATIRRAIFAADGAYYRLDVVDRRIALDETETIAHVRDMLGRLDGPPSALRALKRVCRTRFGGEETVSRLTLPVRLAQDFAVLADGAGIFVNGWLLDPKRLVKRVLLKSTQHGSDRLDQRWTRLPRADVSEAFARDPLFAGLLRPAQHGHGFLAFVPRTRPLAPGESLYLELVLEDESCAFLPLTLCDGEPSELSRRILGLVSLDDPALPAIVAEHLGPIVQALAGPAEAPVEPVVGAAFGRRLARPAVSVIVPLGDGWQDFDAILARLAIDADFRSAEIVVVTDARHADAIAPRLGRYAGFYDACARLVVAEAPLDVFQALACGARSARADLVLFLSPSVVPPGCGWLARLRHELEFTPDCAAVIPTLLYEDDSVRFAAGPACGDDGTGGGAAFHGYPRHWLDGSTPQPVTGGSVECCLIRKATFTALGGFSPVFRATELRNLDFGLRLRASGRCQRWVPEVALYVSDDGAPEPDAPWLRVRRLVDQWAFGRRWQAVGGNPAPARD